MLDQIDLIECVEQNGKAARYGEIVREQSDIYEALGISSPA